MQLKFKQVKIQNFMSIQETQTVDLSFIGYTLVQGVNQNITDNAKSNGSGKSTIFESIVWALTGQTIRGTKDVLNNNTKKDCFVELEFSCDKDNYKIIRTREHSEYGNNLLIYVNNENVSAKGLRDSEKVLSKYLPDLTIDLIGSVIVLGQGLPQKFTSNTPSGRKEILEKLSKSDFMIEDIKNRVSKRKDVVNKQLRDVQDNKLKISTQMAQYRGQLEDNKHELEQLLKNENIDKEYSRNIFVDKIKYLEEEIEKAEKRIVNIDEYVEGCRKKYTEISTEYQNKIKDESKTFDELINKHKESLSSINSIHALKSTEYKKLSSITDVCPTCGQKIAGVEKPDTTELKKEIDELDIKRHSELFAKEDLEEQKETIIQKLEDEKSEILKQITEDANNKKREKANISIELKQNQSYLICQKTGLAEFDQKQVTLEEHKQSLSQNISELSNTIEELEDKFDELCQEEIKAQERVQINSKMTTLIARDFRGILLSNVIDYLNSKAKVYSDYLFENSKIIFKIDGNNLNIFYNEKQYESLSGGERQKLDIVIQFLLRDMLCTFMNFSSNILIADECFDGLDSLGCSKVIDLISNINDIESIYIVTHHDDLNIPCDRQITVIKNESGVTTIQ